MGKAAGDNEINVAIVFVEYVLKKRQSIYILHTTVH